MLLVSGLTVAIGLWILAIFAQSNPNSATKVFNGSFFKGATSASYQVTTDVAGDVEGILSFSDKKLANASLAISGSSGNVLAQKTGPNPVIVAVNGDAGTYTFTVSTLANFNGKITYTLTVTYPVSGSGGGGGGGGGQQSTSDLLSSITGAYWGTNGAGIALESQFGRTFNIERLYYGFNDNIPTSTETSVINAGRIPLISLFPGIRGGGGAVTYIKWADIAAGKQDTYLAARADALKTWGYPILFIFNHEPTNDTQNLGTAAEFVSAWQHIYTLFHSHGATNVVFVFTPFGSTYKSVSNITAWYPGDAYVDWVGADGYNFFDCKPGNNWLSFQSIFQQFYDFSVAHAKPAVIAEWGSAKDASDPSRRAQWFSDAGTVIKSWPNLKGLTYYDNDNSGISGGCNWKIDDDSPSLNAFKSLSQDSYFNPKRPF